MNDTYMDAHTAAVGDTMICYRDGAERVRVPATAARLKLTRLGAGALCCPNATEVALDEGYQTVSSDLLFSLAVSSPEVKTLNLPESLDAVEAQSTSFQVTKSTLKRITLARRLPAREYRSLLEASVPLNGGLRIPLGVLDAGNPCRLMADILRSGSIGVPDPSELELPLFCSDENDARPMLFKQKSCLTPRGDQQTSTENEALLQRIERGRLGARDAAAERWNDRMAQTGQDILSCRRPTAVICFNESEAVQTGDAVRFTLKMIFGFQFRQALRRVRLHGEDYYVYSRLYPKPSGETPAYLREDVCVYSREKLITDPGLSEEAYEKYRLLNML